jgi:hypothetical protein
MELRRKLYTRGSSYETTIPHPLLFSINKEKKYDVIFEYDSDSGRWFLRIEEQKANKNEPPRPKGQGILYM